MRRKKQREACHCDAPELKREMNELGVASVRQYLNENRNE